MANFDKVRKYPGDKFRIINEITNKDLKQSPE